MTSDENEIYHATLTNKSHVLEEKESSDFLFIPSAHTNHLQSRCMRLSHIGHEELYSDAIDNACTASMDRLIRQNDCELSTIALMHKCVGKYQHERLLRRV